MIRSETMNRFKIIIPKENAWEVLNEFGMLGCLELIHTETPGSEMDKKNLRMVKHCEEVLRNCQSVVEYLESQEASISHCRDTDYYLTNLKGIIKQKGFTPKTYFEHVSEEVRKCFEESQRNQLMFEKLTEDLRSAEEELIVSLSIKEVLPDSYG